jgi:hypothetical protein
VTSSQQWDKTSADGGKTAVRNPIMEPADALSFKLPFTYHEQIEMRGALLSALARIEYLESVLKIIDPYGAKKTYEELTKRQEDRYIQIANIASQSADHKRMYRLDNALTLEGNIRKRKPT